MKGPTSIVRALGMELEPLLLDEIVSAFGPERVVAPLNVIREVA